MSGQGHQRGIGGSGDRPYPGHINITYSTTSNLKVKYANMAALKAFIITFVIVNDLVLHPYRNVYL